jgi:hypothetical protein
VYLAYNCDFHGNFKDILNVAKDAWPVSRHYTQQTTTNCQFVYVPPEDGINVSPKHVRMLSSILAHKQSHTQQTKTYCQFVYVPPEEGLNVSPKHVRLGLIIQ